MKRGPTPKHDGPIYVYAGRRGKKYTWVGQTGNIRTRFNEVKNHHYHCKLGKPSRFEILEIVWHPDPVMRRHTAMRSEAMWNHTLRKEGHKLTNRVNNYFGSWWR